MLSVPWLTCVQYGNRFYPNETTPHYKLVSKGVSQSGSGYKLLYQTTDCLCSTPSDCKNASNWVYPYVSRGLDRIVQKYLEVGRSFPQFQYRVRPRLGS